MYYVIAYDIADPRRLGRVARYMERRAVRVQKSVLVFRGDDPGTLLDGVIPLMKLADDCVQAWRIATDHSPTGHRLGNAAPVFASSVVLGGDAIDSRG
jgi:CRISPR/Cas system-associated endoribonuclease Cas2